MTDSTEDLRLLLLRYDTRETNLYGKILDELERRGKLAAYERCAAVCDEALASLAVLGGTAFGGPASNAAVQCAAEIGRRLRELK